MVTATLIAGSYLLVGFMVALVIELAYPPSDHEDALDAVMPLVLWPLVVMVAALVGLGGLVRAVGRKLR